MQTARRNTFDSNHFVITEIHTDWDLRGVQWRADVLKEYSKNYKIRNGEAHVFVNKRRDRSRWVVVWKDTPFLIMTPAGQKLEHNATMTIAADFAATDKIRETLLAEITELK